MSTSALKKGTWKNATCSGLDLGWEHGVEIDNLRRKVMCKYCGVTHTCWVSKFKHHLAWTHLNTEPCPKVPEC